MAKPTKPMPKPKAAPKPKEVKPSKEVDVWAWAASPQAKQIDAGQKASQAATERRAAVAAAPGKAKAAASNKALNAVNTGGLKGRRGKIDKMIDKF